IVMTTFLFGAPTKPNPDVRRAAGRAEPGQGKPRVRAAGRPVLSVEGDAMVAGLIETILSTAGWSVVRPVATVERALETIEREQVDAAPLDVRINGHDAFAVADVLMRRRIPFIFVSGFTRKQLPPGYRHCAYIREAVHVGCDLGAVGRGGARGKALAEPARADASRNPMATEHDHPAQAIRHIARAEEMVAEQRGRVDRLVGILDRREVVRAMRLLRALERHGGHAGGTVSPATAVWPLVCDP